MRQHDFPPFGTGVGLEQLMRAAFGFGPDSIYLCPAPLYHAAPIGWSIGTHRNGGTVVLMERFDAAECLQAIERHQVTHVQFVPTHPDPEKLACPGPRGGQPAWAVAGWARRGRRAVRPGRCNDSEDQHR